MDLSLNIPSTIHARKTPMGDNYLLRKAKYSDLDALLSIYMDSNVNRFLNFEIMDKDTFGEIFNELMSSGEMFVLETNQQIVATCIVMRQKRRANHVASLGTLATHPNFQKKGIGTLFMKTLFKQLKDNGVRRVDLCVEADNHVAQRFYKKMGFQLEGVLQRSFKRPNEDNYVDEHMMALILE